VELGATARANKSRVYNWAPSESAKQWVVDNLHAGRFDSMRGFFSSWVKECSLPVCPMTARRYMMSHLDAFGLDDSGVLAYRMLRRPGRKHFGKGEVDGFVEESVVIEESVGEVDVEVFRNLFSQFVDKFAEVTDENKALRKELEGLRHEVRNANRTMDKLFRSKGVVVRVNGRDEVLSVERG